MVGFVSSFGQALQIVFQLVRVRRDIARLIRSNPDEIVETPTGRRSPDSSASAISLDRSGADGSPSARASTAGRGSLPPSVEYRNSSYARRRRLQSLDDWRRVLA
jgi:hypothetical protein